MIARAHAKAVAYLVGLLVWLAPCLCLEASELVHRRFEVWDWSPRWRLLLSETPILMPPDWLRQISVPPPPGEEMTRQELLALLQLVPERPEKLERIRSQQHNIIEIFSRFLGFPVENIVSLHRLIHHVAFDSVLAAMHFKERYSRARPWNYLPGLAPIVDKPGHPAYPSGHATQSRALALALARIFPACRWRLDILAVEVAHNREIGGVHYRSDSDAGRALGEAVFAVIASVPRYRRLARRVAWDVKDVRLQVARRCYN